MIKLSKMFVKYWYLVVLLIFGVFIQTNANLNVPDQMARMINEGIKEMDTTLVMNIGIDMLKIVLVGSIAAIFVSYLSSVLGAKFGRDLRVKVFSTVESYSANEIDKINTASLITRSTNDINQVQQVWTMIFRIAFMAPMMAVWGFKKALDISDKAALIFAVAIPVLAIIFIVVSILAIPLFSVAQKRLDNLNQVVRERLTGVRVIRAYNRDEVESKRFAKVNKELVEVNVKVNRIMAITMPLFMLVMNLTVVAIIWVGSNGVSDFSMNIGDIAALMQYAIQVLFAFIMIAVIFVMIPRASASAKRINEVLALKPSIVDPKQPSKSIPNNGTLEFRDVAFKYPGAERSVLEGISFKSKPGEVTAIIGGTGSGKSTLINLVPRFYDVTSGSILIDGIDIREMTLEDLRDRVGIVPQKANLFTGTIESNLKFGKGDATEEEMLHALEVAQAKNFVLEKEDGLNSEVSQGGQNFSGGQKQRLSIARALVKKPEVYIFDDSFSALDLKTDALLRAALKNETVTSSVVIVGQRITSIMDADRIIVLDAGRVVGMGTHQELLKTCPIYLEIAKSQLSEEEIGHE